MGVYLSRFWTVKLIDGVLWEGQQWTLRLDVERFNNVELETLGKWVRGAEWPQTIDALQPGKEKRFLKDMWFTMDWCWEAEASDPHVAIVFWACGGTLNQHHRMNRCVSVVRPALRLDFNAWWTNSCKWGWRLVFWCYYSCEVVFPDFVMMVVPHHLLALWKEVNIWCLACLK